MFLVKDYGTILENNEELFFEGNWDAINTIFQIHVFYYFGTLVIIRGIFTNF